MKLKSFLAGKRRCVICAMVLSLCLFLASALWICADIRENRRIDAESVFLKEDLTLPYGEKAKASDFIAELRGTVAYDAEIQPDELGETEVVFEYINIKDKKRKLKFKVQVVDATPPLIYGQNAYTVYRGYDGDLTELMLSGDNLDDSPKREVVGEYDLQTVGSYAVEYVATDASGNESRKAFQLNVAEPPASSQGAAAAPAASSVEYTDFADVVQTHKNDKTEVGIDVSVWQGEIDWSAVKEAGADFAIIRLGYQDGYDGDNITDRFFQTNLENARAVDLPVGIYFYSYANDEEEAKKQAQWALQQIKGHEVELGVTFDWENWRDFNAAGVSFRTLNRVAKAFLDEIESHGYRSILYGSTNYLKLFWDVPEHETWVAQYYDRVTYDGDYVIWQLCDTGHIAGINGAVDIDILYHEEDQP